VVASLDCLILNFSQYAFSYYCKYFIDVAACFG
jgi:hypothetical protein